MRGVTLSTIRTLLKAEIRDLQQTISAADTEYNLALASKQRDLLLGYDWPFMEKMWDLNLVAGTRYYAIPTSDIRAGAYTINFERPVKVDRLFNTKYDELEYGIGTQEYNYQDSDAGDRLDPVLKWQLCSNSSEATNADQVEVWPIPATAQKLRFTGQRNAIAFSSDGDKAEVDDLLLVYFVAADYLTQRQQPNAALVLRKAQEHLIKLRASYPEYNQEPIKIGGYPPLTRQQIRAVPLVVVA